MHKQHNLQFNTDPSNIMHIDLNSCFATVEQQANPFLRSKPVAVAAYTTPNGCIIAPSVEAKKLGIKVGMRVRDGKKIYPNLIIISPDPWKYRFINRKLLSLFRQYNTYVAVKSIDEMVLDFNQTAVTPPQGLLYIASEIKKRIKEEIGSFLTVSIGIAPNRFLAKTASSLHKPDGLDKINHCNFEEIYQKLKVEDFCGIKLGNKVRLNSVGIFTAMDMYQASLQHLISAFQSVLGYYWYQRIRGYEIDSIEFGRKSFGQSYAIYHATDNITTLSKLLCKLVEKMGRRLRNANYTAAGIHITCQYTDQSFWHHGHKLAQKIFSSNDLYKAALKILMGAPCKKPVRLLAVSCFNLEKNYSQQLSILPHEEKKRSLVKALDHITDRFGSFTVYPAIMMETEDKIPDRVAFGGIRELEEFVFQEKITREIDYFTSNTSSFDQ